MKNYMKDYPRPQMMRDSFIDLFGFRDFVFDDEDRGEYQGKLKLVKEAGKRTPDRGEGI